MRITTMGTGHGNPTHTRFNSSTSIEIGDRLYLVDAGAPVHALLVRSVLADAPKAFDRIKAVFVTHMDEDHVAGLPSLIKMILKYPNPEARADVYLPEARAIEPLEQWVRAMLLDWPSPQVELRATKEGPLYDDGTLRVSAVPTRHIAPLADGTPASYAYVLEAEGKRVVSTGDLSSDFSDFPEIARREPCDVCVCEITHYKPPAALPVLMECPIKRMIFNHVHDPWHGEEGERQLREAFAGLPYPFEIAHDGDVFEV